MTLDHEAALALCERTLRARGAAKDTLRAVLGFSRRFLATLDKAVADVDRRDVRKFLANESRRGLSRVTLAATPIGRSLNEAVGLEPSTFIKSTLLMVHSGRRAR